MHAWLAGWRDPAGPAPCGRSMFPGRTDWMRLCKPYWIGKGPVALPALVPEHDALRLCVMRCGGEGSGVRFVRGAPFPTPPPSAPRI